jgi:hypothetical protein
MARKVGGVELRAQLGARLSVAVKPSLGGAIEAQVLDAICAAIDNDRRMVIEADSVGFGCTRRIGRFGVDEEPPVSG